MTARRLEEQDEQDLSDSDVLRQTFMIYGSFFAIVWLTLCFLKKLLPKAFNLRLWVPKLQCALAEQQYGFISWSWRVYGVSDEEILNQCGMDALCLCRAACYGEKLSALGILISVFLLPLYRTAPAVEDTDQVVDRVVRLTIANVPEGSNLLYAAVVASYIFYFFAWHLMLKDFQWFQHNRTKFLSQPKPRNYSIYIKGIPAEYRSNQALSAYFQKLFTQDAVFQSSVALTIPNLQREVAQREKVVQKLEHCLALQNIKGITPTHREGPLDHPINSIDFYKQQLREFNTEISSEIARIEASSVKEGSLHSDSFHSFSDKESGDDDVLSEGSGTLDSKLIDNGTLVSQSKSDTRLNVPQSALLISGVDENENVSEDIPQHKGWKGVMTKAQAIFGKGRNDNAERRPSLKAGSDENLESSSHGSQDINLSLSAEKITTPNPSSHGQHLKQLATKAAHFVGRGDDGKPMNAAFVSFTSLTETNAAIQVTHSKAPYQMIVGEAPNHGGIIWRNVGLDHKAVHLGSLLSFCLSATCCLFYTIPVSFALSVTSVESLEERWPYVESVLEEAPWLEAVLDQIGPLLVSFFNSMLPVVLKQIASLEGYVGESHLEASLFSKLSAFHIIQTFFVANAASSITTGLEVFLDNPTEIIQFLAVQLPPQSTFYIQLAMIHVTFGLGFECLRIFPLLQVFLRQTFGPSLTEKERNRIWLGLRPLSDPRPFFHARLLAFIILSSMILFVYVAIAPITCYVLAFCFLAMGSAFRNQFFYIYSTNPDSGGMLWVRFVNISLICMAVAQLTLGGYLTLKKNNVAAALMIPLLVFQILFHIYIQQRHFRVAARLPAEISIRLDAEGPVDFSFLKDKYKQSALMIKKLEPECPRPSDDESAGNEEHDVEGVVDIQDEEDESIEQRESQYKRLFDLQASDEAK